MEYPERKIALLLETLAHPVAHHVAQYGNLLTYSGTCTDSARLKGYGYIHDWTESRAPILLAQAQVDGRFVALFDVSV